MLKESEKETLKEIVDTLDAIEGAVLIMAHHDHNPHLFRALVSLANSKERIKKAVNENADKS